MENKTLSHLLHLQDASKQGRLVIFVGAGVSRNSGIPTWGTLIDEFKKELNIGDETDPLRVAQIYKDSRGEKEYMDKVKSVLKYSKAQPNPIHKAMLALSPCHFITTNYDDTLEQEIEDDYKQYAVIRCDKDIPNMNYPNAVIKMHGDFETDNIVLTEQDYNDYERNFPLVRAFVLSLFASKTVLFVGFSFTDRNLDIILNDVRNALGNKMQRVYLLCRQKRDGDWNNYYQNKGVNILTVGTENLKSIFDNNEQYGDLLEEGKYTYDALRAILLCKPNDGNDFADDLYSNICNHRNEIRTLGKGFRYLIPAEEIREWYQHSDGVRIGSQYLKELKNRINSRKDIRSFFHEHKNINVNILKQVARDNYLFYLDDIRLLKQNNYNFNGFFKRHNAFNALFSLDIDNLAKVLSALQIKELKADISDLEYPFLLYKTGDYVSAYEVYNNILKNAWKSKRYILYFIALHNIWSIRKGVFNQLNNKQLKKDATEIYRQIDSLNLSEILEKLPIEDAYKRILEQLLSHDELIESSLNTEMLRDELHRQKKNAENGGWSINSNIVSLLSTFEREFLFVYNNYIISDNSKFFDSLIRNTIIGVINSIATPDPEEQNGFGGCTKMSELNNMALIVLVFFSTSKQLDEIFKQFDIDKLPVSESAVELINGWLSNIANSTSTAFTQEGLLHQKIDTILFLLPYLETENIDYQKAYSIIIKFWGRLHCTLISEGNLVRLMNNSSPSKDNTVNLKNVLLHNTEYIERFVETIKGLAYLLKTNNITLESNDYVVFGNVHNLPSLYPLYSIMDELHRNEYRVSIENSLGDLPRYLKFINRNNLAITSLDDFKEKLKNDLHPKSAFFPTCCQQLVVLYNRGIKEYNEIIDNCRQELLGLDFYFTPEKYLNSEFLDVEWIIYNNDIEKLLLYPEYKQKVKDYIKDNNRRISKRDLLSIIKVL